MPEEENIENGGMGAEHDTPGEDRVAKLEREKEEYLNGWKRAKADLINYKREEAERLRDFAKFSNEALIADLLAVLDSFALSLSVIAEDDPARKGMELIRSQLEDALGRHGLERIQVGRGAPFDAAVMEAVSEVSSGEPPGTVAEEVSAGYRLHEKVIRPVKIKMSKGQK